MDERNYQSQNTDVRRPRGTVFLTEKPHIRGSDVDQVHFRHLSLWMNSLRGSRVEVRLYLRGGLDGRRQVANHESALTKHTTKVQKINKRHLTEQGIPESDNRVLDNLS